jgi:hypothetical protein
MFFMRTTVDLPPGLLKAARLWVADHGITLKELFSRALAHEIGTPPVFKAEGNRVKLPLVRSCSGKKRNVSSADIEAIFAAEEEEKFGR